ncbi:hypothetical protein DFH28DRAFT_1125633 [Melampsora americana]|nr:hypothetical protein DFH28DRAFT_1125633 [Melampsora americana]
MPNSTLCTDVLACLKCFFALQVVSLGLTYHRSRKNPTDFTTILAAVIILDQHHSDEDPSEQDHLLLMACHLLLGNISHSALVRKSQKRRYTEDEGTLAIVAFGLDLAQKKRYLVPRHRSLLNRCKKQECFDAWFDASDRRWGVVAWMSKDTFMALVHKISDNPVFHNNSNCPQAPVAWQLLVAMANFGLSGNGGQSQIIAELFKMAEGSVENYTNRCIEALVALESTYVKWPTPEEQAEISAEIGGNSFFKKCVGFINGTLIALAYAPQKNGEDYYCRKSFYAITLGTTRKNAGSAERFETIDRGYPVLFAKLARDPSKKPQTLVYLSVKEMLKKRRQSVTGSTGGT